MRVYKNLVADVLENGTRRGDRTGTGTISLFGTQTRYDLREGFPLVTIKRTMFKSIVKELLWFLRGETNINTLGCGIWDEWVDENGELGPVYGAQWRKWAVYDGGSSYIDQIGALIEGLKENPLSRRHIVTAWNPAEIDEMALPPCHTMFQLYASPMPASDPIYDWPEEGAEEDHNYPKYYLDLQLYQRSCDLGLGASFNIASYSLLLTLIAREVNMVPRFFIHTMGDAHIYQNHIEGVKEMLIREPRSLPKVLIADKPMPYPGCPRDGSVLEPDDFKLEGYNPHGRIKFEIAI